MNILKKAYCRIYQAAFRAALPLLPYREPQILHSCKELPEALSGNSINNLMIVTDNGIVKFGLAAKVTAVLDEAGISYCVYDKTCPNPTVKNVEAALKLYKEH
ncbi:MAG: iron-containing alcohol dehydrogenase, partial [Lachnospiraceae bacterium]|nr:iron-containing alcohol dehydrogenase [Lachnospiraceae bacterium]